MAIFLKIPSLFTLFSKMLQKFFFRKRILWVNCLLAKCKVDVDVLFSISIPSTHLKSLYPSGFRVILEISDFLGIFHDVSVYWIYYCYNVYIYHCSSGQLPFSIIEQVSHFKGHTFVELERRTTMFWTFNYISLKPDDVNLWYFKPRPFKLTKLIVWNIKGLRKRD